MADKKISELDAGGTPQNADAVPIARAGSNFSLAMSDIKAYATAGIAAGGIAISAGAGLASTGTVSFADGSGISFGLNGQTLTATVKTDYLTTAALSNHSHGNPQLNLTNLSGTTASNSGGFTLSLSAGDYLTTARASNDAVGLNTALTAGPLAWTVNSSGISLNAGSAAGTTSGFGGNLISGSITHNTAGLNLSLNHPAWLTTAAQSNHSHGNPQLNLTNLSGTTASNSAGLTLSLSAAAAVAQTNQTLGLYAVSNTTGASSSSTFDARTLSFQGAGIASVGFSNGSVVVSVPAGGGAGDGVNILAAGTQTANTTGTVVFSNSNGVTFGMSNSSIITASVAGVQTLSGYAPYPDTPLVAGQLGQGTLQFDPQRLPDFQFDRAVFQLINTNSSNSSGSHTLSMWLALYTKNVSTLSLLASTSSSTALTHSGTAGSYSLYSGIRHFTIPWTQTISSGEYWIGFLSRTTSGGANGSYSNLCLSNLNSNFLGHFGSSHNTTYQMTLGQGVYTATTNAIPGSVGITQIRGSDSMALRAPNIFFASGTI